MKVAVQCAATVGPARQIVGEDGRITGHNSGLWLLRRILEKYPGATLIDHDPRQARACDGFRVAPLAKVDPIDTWVISMDLVHTPALSYEMRVIPKIRPKITNFFWANVSDDDYKVRSDRALLGLSAAYFPTYANSRKAAGELLGVVRETQTPKVLDKVQIGWGTLGIDLAKVPQEREPHDKPVVLYPGIYVFDRKQPLLWADIVDTVAVTHDFVGRVRVSHRHAGHVNVPRAFENRAHIDLAPQDKQAAYYESLRTVDVALATSRDESYGLAYMEAMYAGAVGILPDKPWTWTLVPGGYPFVYKDRDEAIAMLRYVLDDLDRARADVAQAGFTKAYVEEHHDIDKFFDSMEAQALAWYPLLEEQG